MTASRENRPTLVITGGLGLVASRLIPVLAKQYQLRVVDRMPPGAGTADVGTYVQADLREPAAAAEALQGATAVVHLAGSADPRATWEQAFLANVVTARWLLQAAADAHVPRVVLASSLHAIGEYNRPQFRPVPSDVPPRPCCPYGLSKTVVEALGRLHAEATGATVVCLRLGLVGWPLTEQRYLGQWLSDGDAGRLFAAALTAPVAFGVYTGVSANTRHHWDITRTCDELGYHPHDDSEPFAPDTGAPAEVLCRLFDDTENTIPEDTSRGATP